MKYLLLISIRFFGRLLSLWSYFCLLTDFYLNGKRKYAIKPRKYKKFYVLTNGPSLKDSIPDLLCKKGELGSVFAVVNFFALESVFWSLKPQFYVLADPAFFSPAESLVNKVKNLFEELKRVNWTMELVVPLWAKQYEKQMLKNISRYTTILYVNTTEFVGPGRFKFYSYQNGIACPCIQTVANLAIFLGIQFFSCQIMLYGLDHSFFKTLCVNENNEVCTCESHFYGTDEKKVFYLGDSKKSCTVVQYLTTFSRMFQSHEILRQYARYLGESTIINCTKDSMVDAYERQ